MNRKVILSSVAVGLLTTVVLSGTAIAAEPTSTWFSWAAKDGDQLEVIGNVCHATQEDCGTPTGDMKFTLFKRRDGVWVRVDNHVSTRDEGWTAKLNAPRRGKCKLVARYLGDSAYDPSKAVLRGMCNDNDWIY